MNQYGTNREKGTRKRAVGAALCSEPEPGAFAVPAVPGAFAGGFQAGFFDSLGRPVFAKEEDALEIEIMATKLQILDIAAELHKLIYGEIPAWIKKAASELETKRFFHREEHEEREGREGESYEP